MEIICPIGNFLMYLMYCKMYTGYFTVYIAMLTVQVTLSVRSPPLLWGASRSSWKWLVSAILPNPTLLQSFPFLFYWNPSSILLLYPSLSSIFLPSLLFSSAFLNSPSFFLSFLNDTGHPLILTHSPSITFLPSPFLQYTQYQNYS